MFMRIVMQLSGLIMGLYTRVLELLRTRLWNPVNNLRVSFIQGFQSAVTLWFQLVKQLLNIKALLVPLITVVQSTKVAVILALTQAWALGQQLLTIVRQIPQRVRQAFKKDN